MNKSAVLSSCGTYRYQLVRDWAEDEKMFRLLFVMLNPSTADAKEDDPTIRKCVTIAKNFQFTSIEVVNLFAYRSTDTSELFKRPLHEAIGPLNGYWQNDAVQRANAICVAWGKNGGNGTKDIQFILEGKGMLSLAVNKDGSPKHPLYCKNSSELTDWKFKR